jgi:hypothetical protein
VRGVVGVVGVRGGVSECGDDAPSRPIKLPLDEPVGGVFKQQMQSPISLHNSIW